MPRKLIAVLVGIAWVGYVGTTGYVLWRIFTGDPPRFLKDYTLGTNACWVTFGVFLWLVTEWLRGEPGDR